MDKFERIRACIAGEELDRAPFSMWMHYHMRDRNPFTLSQASADLLDTYDMDILKITPTGLFFVQDFGAAIQFGKTDWQHPLMTDSLLKSAADLENLPMLDLSTGALGRELDMVKLACRKVNRKAPVLMTVFTPLTIVCKMLGNANIPATLQFFMENHPTALHSALQKLSVMIGEFIDRCIAAGVDGFFFATQAANFQTLRTQDQYKEFGVTYDFPLVERIKGAGKLCLLHVCMHEVMLDVVKDYPVDIVNWDNIYSGTTISQAREIIPDKVLAGGIDIFKISTYSKQEIDDMVQRALNEAVGGKFMLAPTCVLLASTPHENLLEISTYMHSLSNLAIGMN